MALKMNSRVRSQLQLALLFVLFIAVFQLNQSSSLTGAAVLPPGVEQFVPTVTIGLGIAVLAWTVYLFFPRRSIAPQAPPAKI